MRLAFVAVITFAAGYMVGASFDDAKARASTPEQERLRENAERYAKVIAHCLNGGTIETEEHTAKCRVRKKEDY